jgi:ferredoxin
MTIEKILLNKKIMKEKYILKEDLYSWVKSLLNENHRIVSYIKNEERFKQIKDISEFELNPSIPPSKISVKEFLIPPTEPLLYYKKNKNDIEIIDPPKDQRKTFLFGIKPCDAKAVEVLDKVFNWDYKDNFFNEKKENTIIIGLKCNYSDEFCFCKSVNISPDSSAGSDIYLIPKDENSYIVQIITEKGEKILSGNQNIFKDNLKESYQLTKTNNQKIIDSDLIRKWLDTNFDHPIWEKFGETCLGCGKCAFICPTCYCFDIVDEEYSISEGRRMKNWDACQFGKFTLHASGHNPRENQQKRYRQRISHKFKYYHDKFDEILCTGCGRCSRECPVGISISNILDEIETLAKQ